MYMRDFNHQECYVSPQLEVVEIAVEMGFSLSNGGGFGGSTEDMGDLDEFGN